MNFTIDLLPNVERSKPIWTPIIPVVGLVVCVATTAILVYSYFDLTDSVENLDSSIVSQTELRDSLQLQFIEETTGVTEYNYVMKYKNLDQTLNTIFKESSELKDNFYRLLPGEASVENFNLENTGSLTLIVRFPSKGDAATYLYRLLQAGFVESAELQSIDISDEDELFYTSLYQLKLKTIVGETQ
ncbi:hypothetical protein [Bacillus solitudinis]|uniref:hypothetical protein n=1 Tax=Bacillus solitudinis TaxID=2014074 RepID=UPI000C23241C|nr:hypothetical protein [Bacillus solitudinis]